MKITPEGLSLVAARVGKGSAEALVRLDIWEQKAAELETQRATLMMIQAEIGVTNPLHRGHLKERLVSIKTRIRSLSAALKRRADKLARLAATDAPLPSRASVE